ncbi:MAG: hypothetical protein K2M48_00060, partial [Clostridiales bacterium]|nr:hypothetical protein [Clostridiales bacterium]
MMRNRMSNLFDGRAKRTAIITAIIFLLTALAGVLMSFRAVTLVDAETRAGKANTVTLHVYD